MRLAPVPYLTGVLAVGLLAWPQAAGAVAFLAPGLAEPGRGRSVVVEVEHHALPIPEKVTRFKKKHLRSIHRSIHKSVGPHRGHHFDSHKSFGHDSHHGAYGAGKGRFKSHGHGGDFKHHRRKRGVWHSGSHREHKRWHKRDRVEHFDRFHRKRGRFDRKHDRFEHRLEHAERRRIDREIGFRRLREGDVRRPLPNPNVYRYFTVKPRHRPLLSP